MKVYYRSQKAYSMSEVIFAAAVRSCSTVIVLMEPMHIKETTDIFLIGEILLHYAHCSVQRG